MKLSRDEIIVILTWIPTGTTYLAGDIRGVMIMLLGNIAGGIIYLLRDAIRCNQRLMRVLKMIF